MSSPREHTTLLFGRREYCSITSPFLFFIEVSLFSRYAFRFTYKSYAMATAETQTLLEQQSSVDTTCLHTIHTLLQRFIVYTLHRRIPIYSLPPPLPMVSLSPNVTPVITPTVFSSLPSFHSLNMLPHTWSPMVRITGRVCHHCRHWLSSTAVGVVWGGGGGGTLAGGLHEW